LTEYLTEQEQIELLKNWIKQYSLVILTGVLLAVACISGWRYWQQRQANIAYHASSIYDEMLTKRAQHNTTAIITQAQKLYSHYPNTTYGQMAALTLARAEVMRKNYPEAKKYLSWVIKKSHIRSFRQIARLRLARILIAEHDVSATLALLEKSEAAQFNGLTEEVRGDAYFAMQDFSKARAAYKKALSELPNALETRPLLQMKYDNLASTDAAL
jgi:predicted negative regulator of RcsB-dependent stress response